MTKTEILEKILKNINNISGVQASAVASRDGLVICSSMSNKLQGETFVAMSATMMRAAETAILELDKGLPDRIVVEYKTGKIIGTGTGQKAFLLVMTQPEASLGQVFIEMTKASEEIIRVLG